MGCQTDVFTSSRSKEAMIKKLGGDNVYVWTKGEHSHLKDYYDCVLNTLPVSITADEAHSIMEVVKPYGKWLQVGIPDIKDDLVIRYTDLVLKSVSVIGSLVGGVKHYQQMLDFVEKHGIELIAEHYKFD